MPEPAPNGWLKKYEPSSPANRYFRAAPDIQHYCYLSVPDNVTDNSSRPSWCFSFATTGNRPSADLPYFLVFFQSYFCLFRQGSERVKKPLSLTGHKNNTVVVGYNDFVFTPSPGRFNRIDGHLNHYRPDNIAINPDR